MAKWKRPGKKTLVGKAAKIASGLTGINIRPHGEKKTPPDIPYLPSGDINLGTSSGQSTDRMNRIQSAKKMIAQAGGDINDPVFQNLLMLAGNGQDENRVVNLETYAMTKVGQLTAERERLEKLTGKGGTSDSPLEGSILGSYDAANKATLQLAMPELEGELARLGILHGGALGANTEQIRQQMAVARGQQESGYRAGTAQDMSALTVDNINALLGLRNQQSAQNLALQMANKRDRLTPFQRTAGGAMAGASAGSVFGPWGTGIGAIGGGIAGNIWGR